MFGILIYTEEKEVFITKKFELCSSKNYFTYFTHKIINDPIYGIIGLSALEEALMDTPAMQRLRRIHQMGLSSYVFPGGEHSRFSHSLGVLHIMGRMCDHLYRRHPDMFTLEDVCKLRLAALLHDVGHTPFSHLTESVYSYKESFPCRENDPELLCRISNAPKNKSVNHEHLGAQVVMNYRPIAELLTQNGWNPREIGHIIQGLSFDPGQRNTHLYIQMMHSSIDADRLDYLLRDSAQIGVVFGHVELDYIIHCMELVKAGPSGHHILVFDTRAQHALEHFLMSRYFYYSQSILHRTISAFEAVMKTLLYRMSGTDDFTFSNYNRVVSSVDSPSFLNFDDNWMWEQMGRYAANAGDYDRRLWDILHSRREPYILRLEKVILPKDGSMPEDSRAKRFLKLKKLCMDSPGEAARELGLPVEHLGTCFSSLELEHSPDPKNPWLDGAIKLRASDGSLFYLASDSTSLMNKMTGFTSNALNIFSLNEPDEARLTAFLQAYTDPA